MARACAPLIFLLLCRVMRTCLSVETLYIAGFFPLSRDIPQGSLGRGVLPAVRLAVADVNNDTTLLPGYRLEMKPNDTKVGQRYRFIRDSVVDLRLLAYRTVPCVCGRISWACIFSAFCARIISYIASD